MTATLPTNHQSPGWGGNFLEWKNATNNHEFVMNGATSIGATTITLDRSVGWITAGRNFLAVVDSGKTTTEVRLVTGLSGATLTCDLALRFAHADRVPVLLVADDQIPTYFFGAEGDSSTDDQKALQRGMIECDRISLWLSGVKTQHQITQPVFGQSPHLRNILIRCQGSAFAPIDTLGAAFANVQNAPVQFTALASTNEITCSAVANVGNIVAFNAPSGETLPGSIVSGRWYYIISTGTGTFKFSATRGGSEFDITADGAGWCYTDVNTLGRLFFEDVYLKGGSGNAGLNILRADIQQPGYTRNLHIDDSASGGGVSFWLSGQISNHHNMEVNFNANTIGLQVGKTVDTVDHFSPGHGFFGLNMTGAGLSSNTGIHLVNAPSCEFDNLWLEGLGTGMKIGDSASGKFSSSIEIGSVYISNVQTQCFVLDHVFSSFHIGSLEIGGTTPPLVVDNVRSRTMTPGGASDGRGIANLIQGQGAYTGLIIGSQPQSYIGSLEIVSNLSGTADQKLAMRNLAGRDGYIVSAKGYFGTAGGVTAKVKALIYADSAGAPGALLATSNEIIIAPATARAWQTFTFATPFRVYGGQRYWIGYIDDQPLLYSYWQQSPTTTGQGLYNTDTYSDGPSDPYGSTSSADFISAFYLLYG